MNNAYINAWNDSISTQYSEICSLCCVSGFLLHIMLFVICVSLNSLRRKSLWQTNWNETVFRVCIERWNINSRIDENMRWCDALVIGQRSSFYEKEAALIKDLWQTSPQFNYQPTTKASEDEWNVPRKPATPCHIKATRTWQVASFRARQQISEFTHKPYSRHLIGIELTTHNF